MRGDGTVYLRGQVCWIKFYRNGEPVREAARDKDGHGITDAVAAQKFLRNRLKELHGEEVGGPAFITASAKKTTCGDLLDGLKADYELRGKDSAQNLSYIELTREYWGGKLAVGVKAEQIDAYIQKKLAEEYRPASINRRLQVLSQAFGLAVRRGTLARAPYICHLSEKGNERQGFFSEQEIMDVLAALPDDGLRDFAEWASETGQRKGEIEQLTWNMVEGDELRIPTPVCKNGRGRVLPIGPELRVILDRRKKARRVVSLDKTEQLSELIFHRGDARPVGDFKKSWRTATKTAKCAGRLFHDFRRTAARRFIAAGINQNTAKAVTGHLTDSMFSRYQIISSADMLAAQTKVAEFRKAVSK
jgi:integrase